MTEGQEDESGDDDDDDDDDAEYGEEETLTTAHVNNRSVSESTDATAPATTPLLPNDADFRSSSKPAGAAATPENPDDKSPNRKSSLTVGVCSGEEEEKVAVSAAASGHGAICSTLRNVSPAEVKERAVQKCNEINFVFSLMAKY